MRIRRHLSCVAAIILVVCSLAVPCPVAAQAPAERQSQGPSILEKVKWQHGPATASMDRHAEIDVPENYLFANGSDARMLMEAMGNPPSKQEVGFFAPSDLAWFVVFEFDDVGYVKDEEKDKLDPAAMLRSIKKGTEASNKIRRSKGFSALHITGWETKPYYNPDTHNLEWALRAQDDDGSLVVNHNTRILGRHGVMKATLVVEPEKLPAVLPVYREKLATYRFKKGERYAEYRQGDKMAKYGLTALVVGGATAVAVKSGLLRHLWKLLVVAGAAISAFFKRLFGRKSDAPTAAEPTTAAPGTDVAAAAPAAPETTAAPESEPTPNE